ncbi:MAG: SCO family protein [Opitutaceae bacterium]
MSEGVSRLFRLRLLRPLSLFAACGALLAGSSGCGKQENAAGAQEEALPEGRHRMTGTIVSVSEERRSLLVDHEEIPGYMPRMTMEFKVASGDLANARAGMRIRGVIYEAGDGFHLEEIWPVDAAGSRIVDEAARVLRQDTVTRGRAAYREVGEHLPDFALYDQSGEVVQAARFRGRQIALNFIFTRCPDATMCPASTMKMIELQKLAKEAGIANFEIVSITLDPEYDTPGVLRQYAEQRGIDTSNFSFLTGPEAAIKDLMSQLGVLAFQDGPLITHTLATVLIDETGRIIHRVDGSSWQPEDFASRLHKTDTSGMKTSA